MKHKGRKDFEMYISDVICHQLLVKKLSFDHTARMPSESV